MNAFIYLLKFLCQHGIGLIGHARFQRMVESVNQLSLLPLPRETEPATKPEEQFTIEQIISADYWIDFLSKVTNWFVTVFPSLILLVLFLVVSLRLLKFFLNRLLRFTIRKAKKLEDKDELEVEKRVKTLIGILLGIGKIIIWSTVIVIFLKKMGIDVGPILAGAGVVGLAVGFGAQELVRDFISGFFIILENQVRTGDVVIINGTTGLVEKIELRTVTLRDFTGTVHVFQNGKVNTLSNMTKEWSAIAFEIGVSYKEDPDHVMSVMAEVGAQLQKDSVYGELILEPIEIAGVENFADSSIIIKARFKTKPVEQWRVGREYRKRLKKAFDEQNIEIPFPQTTIHLGEHATRIIHPND